MLDEVVCGDREAGCCPVTCVWGLSGTKTRWLGGSDEDETVVLEDPNHTF